MNGPTQKGDKAFNVFKKKIKKTFLQTARLRIGLISDSENDSGEWIK